MPTDRSKRLEKGRTERNRSAWTGFTLIELLVVIAICLIMASFAAPIYSRILARSHEAVLRSDLFTMRQMIRQYTLDNHRPPESLDDLEKAGYLSGGLPVDPFTGSNQTWQAEQTRAMSHLRSTELSGVRMLRCRSRRAVMRPQKSAHFARTATYAPAVFTI